MTSRLQGKAALVTGGSRGIGRAIAERLAADGAWVAIGFQSNKTAADEVIDGIKSRGGQAIGVEGDVSNVAILEAAFDRVTEYFGGIDIVVNNAAITEAGPIASVTEEIFDRLVAVNLKGVFFANQLAAARVRDGGRIINIATVLPAAHVGILGAYGATKGGIPILTRSLAREIGPRGITVNAVAPGPTNTDMLVPEAREQLNAHLDDIPLRRIGEPQDVADVVAFLASDDARWITGHVVPVAGGIE